MSCVLEIGGKWVMMIEIKKYGTAKELMAPER